jgi:hypothetical protein
MRPPRPEMADPFLSLQGRRVDVHVAGQRIRARLLSVRDGFLCVDPDWGPRCPASAKIPGLFSGLLNHIVVLQVPR